MARPPILQLQLTTYQIMKAITPWRWFILQLQMISRIPSIPTSFQATTYSSSQIDLFWNASSDNVGVTGYKVYRDGTQIAITSNTIYQDTGLSSSTTYSYAVSAIDGAAKEG